jgi:hypothetical protein
MMYHLFLDDERNPERVTWVDIPIAVYTVVRSYEEFVAAIEQYGVPIYVTFDHDLADAHYVAMLNEVNGKEASYGLEKTGLDCAKWLVDHCNEQECLFPNFNVHSMNPIGKARIFNYVASAKENGYIS